MNGFSFPRSLSGPCRSLPTPELDVRADRGAGRQLSETWPGSAWRRFREYGRWTEGVRKALATHGR